MYLVCVCDWRCLGLHCGLLIVLLIVILYVYLSDLLGFAWICFDSLVLGWYFVCFCRFDGCSGLASQFCFVCE